MTDDLVKRLRSTHLLLHHYCCFDRPSDLGEDEMIAIVETLLLLILASGAVLGLLIVWTWIIAIWEG